MKNLFNGIFFIILSFILLISFWEDVSSNSYNTRLYNYEIKNTPELPFLPLGTDQYRKDYAVVLSNSIKYNISISIIGSVIFLFSGITLALGMGMIEYSNQSNKLIYYSKIFFNNLSKYLTEIFQTIPLLLILLLSVLYFQLYIINPDLRLTMIIIVLALFSSPKLSIPIENNIRRLKREEFILAAKASGISKINLIFKHILYYESKGLIILQTINFFLFSIMIEIFLTWFGKGTPITQNSIGKLIFDSSFYLDYLFNNPYSLFASNFQDFVLCLTPFVFIFLLSLTIRWFGDRILLITDTK